MVECHLAKVDVEGSSPFSRSKLIAVLSAAWRTALQAAFAFGGANADHLVHAMVQAASILSDDIAGQFVQTTMQTT